MNRRLGRYFAGCLLSFLGGHVINFGLVQWAQEVLLAPAWSGALLLLCFGLPVVFGWHAGALSDRGAPLRVARRAQGALLLAAAVLALAAWVPWLRREQLGLAWSAALLGGIGWSYGAPARLAFLPRMVDAGGLRGAAILFNVLSTVGFGGAPLIVGVVRQRADWTWVFLVAAALLTLGLVCWVGLDRAGGTARVGPVAAAGSPVGQPGDDRSVRQGWAYIGRTPLIAQLLLASAVAHLLVGPIQVLLPPFLDTALGLEPAGRGVFLGLAAPSLIAGGLLALSLRQLQLPGRLLLLGIAVSALSCALLSRATALPPAVLAFTLTCLAAGCSASLIAASLQLVSDDAYRGRVMASYAISTQFFPAFAGLGCGILLAHVGPRTALAAFPSGVFALAVALLLGMPALRTWRRSG